MMQEKNLTAEKENTAEKQDHPQTTQEIHFPR